MARCFPPSKFATSESSAELRLLTALESQLDADFVVLHSVAWISRPGGSGPRDGEMDLLICHPRRGLLVIEVKGGRVTLDYRTQQWTSTDGKERVHNIKNPFEQAKKGKYGILEKLKESPVWQKLRIGRFNIGHAVFLPDVGDGDRLRGPDAAKALIGDRGDMEDLVAWVDQALAFWEGDPSERTDIIGDRGVETVVQIFARVATTRPLLSARIQDEEVHRIELTRRQATILDMLRRQRRVMIAGGAGTGKTLIAREKAVRLADEGLSTLLVCFNRGLADRLREQCQGIANLDVATFHQVCIRWIERARAETSRDLMSEARRDYQGADEFDQLMPIALANAIDALGPAYDAIIVDEGQDFGDEFWLPIEMLLRRPEEGMLYVFLDENQDIYHRSANIPVASEPMMLDRNCRNTGAIHGAAYRYYRGMPVEAPEIPGVEVEKIWAKGIERQARMVGSLVTRLVAEEAVDPHEIAVLLGEGRLKIDYERALKQTPIPSGSRYERLENYGPGVITVDTVARFKGLERPIIILWALDGCTSTRDRETLYVGLSRAKTALYLCGSREACDRVF